MDAEQKYYCRGEFIRHLYINLANEFAPTDINRRANIPGMVRTSRKDKASGR